MSASSRPLHAQNLPARLRQDSAAVPPDRESGTTLAPLRAKAIARPERRVSARLFDTACQASRLSNVVIAKWLGVDERRVREMRSGEKPVSLEQLARMPPGIEATVAVGLVEHAKSRAIPTKAEAAE